MTPKHFITGLAFLGLVGVPVGSAIHALNHVFHPESVHYHEEKTSHAHHPGTDAFPSHHHHAQNHDESGKSSAEHCDHHTSHAHIVVGVLSLPATRILWDKSLRPLFERLDIVLGQKIIVEAVLSKVIIDHADPPGPQSSLAHSFPLTNKAPPA